MQGNIYSPITLTLAAGETRSIATYARHFRILSNSLSTLPKVRIGDEPVAEIETGLGIDLSPYFESGKEDPFVSVQVTNPHSSNSMTIKIALSLGYVSDDRLTVSGSVTVQDGGGSITVDEISNGVTDVAVQTIGTTASEIAAANANRLELYIFNIGSTNIFVGSASVSGGAGTERGKIILPNGGMIIKTTAAYNAASSAAGGKILVSEETRS